MHGLRHPVLSPGLPAGQPDPGVERSRLSRRGAGRAIERLHATNNSRSSPGSCARRRARASCVLDINEDQPVTIKQIEVGDRRPGVPGQGHVERAASQDAPARRSPSSAPAPPGWPPHSSSPEPVTTSPSTSTLTGWAGCSTTASPEFKMEKAVLDRRLRPDACRGHPVA